MPSPSPSSPANPLRALRHPWILWVVGLKVLLLGVFASGLLQEAFLPFVQHTLATGTPPWGEAPRDAFPYHPLMLYWHTMGYALGRPLEGLLGSGVAFKWPMVLMDLGVLYLLMKLLPNRRREAFAFYFTSPIILFAIFVHSQLDLLPVLGLFLAVYYLRKQKALWAALFYGLALCAKLHVLVALPLLMTYLVKTDRRPRVWGLFLLVPALLYAAITGPFLSNPAFQADVLWNARQAQVLDVGIPLGGATLVVPLFALALLYGKFATYRKVNADLLDAYLALSFGVFLFFTEASPAWYVWLFPYLSLFCMKFYRREPRLAWLYGALSLTYLVYYGLFYQAPHTQLTLLGQPLPTLAPLATLKSVAFTALEAALLGTSLAIYRLGVRSNSVYKREPALVIGIGGDSGTGKSTLLTFLRQLFHHQVVEIEGDGDHKWERYDDNWQHTTHLDPKANHLHRQAQDILALKAGKSIQRVEYDHATGRFTDPQPVESAPYVVLSGLHPFYLPLMRQLIDIKIYLDPEDSLKRHWKICRDHQKRGYTKAQVLAQIEKRLPDAQKYIYPQRDFADVVIRYEPLTPFELGDPAATPAMALVMTLDSSIHLEHLVTHLNACQIPVAWDYADDLRNQTLRFTEPVSPDTLEHLARELIETWEEVAATPITWQADLNGLIQLVLLLMIHQKKQEAVLLNA